MDKRKSALINAAIAGVLAAGTVMIAPSASAEVNCQQSNECKGHGACKSVDGKQTCAGQNSCKNHVAVVADEAACTAAGGKVVADAAKGKGKSKKKG